MGSEWTTLPGEDGQQIAVRSSFRNARVDDFTAPQGQHPDSFAAMSNVIAGVNVTIDRRWGTTLFSNPGMTARHMFEAHFSNGRNRFVLTAADGTGVASANNGVAAINENGSLVTSPFSIFIPSQYAHNPHAVTSRDYVYFTDGINSDLLKWDSNDNPTTTSPLSVSKWGISAPTSSRSDGSIGATPTDEGTGNIFLVGGRAYTVAFYNPVTGHVSDVLPFTGRMGITSDPTDSATGVTVVLDDIPTNPNAAVDGANQRLILATSDGGALDTLYEVTILTDNTTTTYTDNKSETTLLNSEIWAELDSLGNQIGLIGNTPPSEILTDQGAAVAAGEDENHTLVAVHRGRIYILQGHYLYWSKSLAELTTSTGKVAGRWEECFPVENQTAISSTGAEVGRGLLSDDVNLYIGTNRNVLVLTSDQNPGAHPPRALFHEVGVLNQMVWQVVWHEGQMVGAIWVTPDHRVIFSNFNEYFDIGNDPTNGTSIQTALNNMSVSDTDRATALFVAYQGHEFYILAPGPTSSPFVYNCRTKAWIGRWFPTTGAGDLPMCVAYMYDSVNGRPLPIFTAATGNRIFRWNPATTLDYSDDNGHAAVKPHPALETNWLDFGNPSEQKCLNSIEVQTDAPEMTIDISGAQRPDNDDTAIASDLTLDETVFGTLRTRTAHLQTKHRLYQFTLGGIDDTDETHLLSYMHVEYVPLLTP